MARSTNKVTTMRARIKTLLEAISGSPNYWYSSPTVRYGIPTGFEATSALKLYVSRGTSVRDESKKTSGAPFQVMATIDFTIQGHIIASDPYLACEQIEQDIVAALRSDPGLSCDSTAAVDTQVTYETSEVKVGEGIAAVAKTTVVLTVEYLT